MVENKSSGRGSDGEAGQVRAADRAGYVELRGVPGRRDQSADRDTLAAGAHDPEHGGRAGALSARAHPAPPKRHPRYLSLDERMAIADLRREKRTVREIARDRPVSCDGQQGVAPQRRRSGRYLPHIADRLATERIARPRARRVLLDIELRAVVDELLGKRWSPEQVAHELRERFPDQPDRQLCTESIYQAIYDPDVPVTRPAKRAVDAVGAACRARNAVAG